MSRAWAAWQRFWFEPLPVSTLVLLRIAFGALVFLWGLSVLPDAKAFFGPSGVLPHSPHAAGAWSLLDVWKSDTAAVVLVALVAVAGLALACGAFTRVAAFVVLAGFISLSKRNPYIGNSGDALIRTLALYLFLSPAGAALSMDRLRHARSRFWDIPARAPWALRLVQVQISMLYIATVWAKLRGHYWPHGTAVNYAFRLDDLTRFPIPDIGSSSLLIHVITYAALATEFSLGVLVWRRALRPWVLLAGVCLHLGIDYRLRVGFFSWAILTSYIAFIPAATATRLIESARARLRSAPWPGSVSTR